jgi:hypothetical protein
MKIKKVKPSKVNSNYLQKAAEAVQSADIAESWIN